MAKLILNNLEPRQKLFKLNKEDCSILIKVVIQGENVKLR